MKYIAMKDPNWELAQFNASTDVEKAQKADPDGILKSDNANIKAFFDRGGKLLMYQGFADPQVTSDNAIAITRWCSRRSASRQKESPSSSSWSRHVSLSGWAGN
jgi:hypothetical protein